jgi:hypothetical protein
MPREKERIADYQQGLLHTAIVPAKSRAVRYAVMLIQLRRDTFVIRPAE